jgi:hypothetical protein
LTLISAPPKAGSAIQITPGVNHFMFALKEVSAEAELEASSTPDCNHVSSMSWRGVVSGVEAGAERSPLRCCRVADLDKKFAQNETFGLVHLA